MNFETFLENRRTRVDQLLDQHLPPADQEPTTLHTAMRYAVLNGGKRLRPLFIYTVGEIFNAPVEILDIPACAVELIHAFSLIHDDLPAMDDDDFRRGKPSCHKAFDEAIAILAGDALPYLAIEILCTLPSPEMIVKMIRILTKACGSFGLSGGQALDIHFTKQKTGIIQIENMYALKTGALFRACIQLGAISASLKDQNQLNILDEYAQCIGLAFQIQDDIFDLETENKKIVTYPMLVGVESSKAKVKELHEKALAMLENIKADTTLLIALTNHVMQRKY
jgi:geranylgeranyl pyrophosphate synthase